MDAVECGLQWGIPPFLVSQELFFSNLNWRCVQYAVQCTIVHTSFRHIFARGINIKLGPVMGIYEQSKTLRGIVVLSSFTPKIKISFLPLYVLLREKKGKNGHSHTNIYIIVQLCVSIFHDYNR